MSTPPDFPAGFLWGAATSAHQVEGGNVNNDWWDFEHDPSSAARESSLDGIDHLHRYAEDFTLLATLGHNAHRLSLEWSRIEPAPGEFSRSAVSHYRRVLTALAGAGLTGFVTLHHFTLPRWFAAQGGWLGPDAVTSFSRYCEHVAAELGDLMPFVCTVNEPQMVALHGYLEGYHPPGITNPTLWKRVGRVLLRAHQAAVRAVRSHSSQSLTGLAVQMPLLAPIREDEACQALHRAMQHEVIDLYLDGLSGGDRGDWLGVQYYRKQWVDPASPTLFADPPPGSRLTQMGWAVYPDGLRQVLHRAAETGLPLYVTENGVATEDDEERLDYLETHLAAVALALREGLDVRGYLHWSAFDNFEWAEGCGPKFGLIAIDHNRDFTRVPKPSAYAFANVARTGRLDTLPGRSPGTAEDRVLWHPWDMQSVYAAVGGDEGMLRLAEAWHRRVMADEIVSHAFSHGFHPQHSERLAAYWAQALGGPTTYSDTVGDETSVVRIHSGNGPHEEMDRRAIACFDQALGDVGLKTDEPLRQVLHDYFTWATTTTMSRYHESADDVPEGLSIPHWSWDGLQG